MVFKIAILALAALGLIFVVAPFFNYAAFDFQCQASGCSGEMCKARTALPSKTYTGCEFKPEYGCNKDCKARNFRCSFDEEVQNDCLKCVQNCTVLRNFSKVVEEAKDSCFTSCYNQSFAINST